MAFIHDDYGIEGTDHLNQRRFIRVGEQHGLVLHQLRECRKIAVFLIRFPPLFFAGAERIVAEDKNRKLFRHRGGVEILAVK